MPSILMQLTPEIQSIGTKSHCSQHLYHRHRASGERAKDLIRNNMAICDNRHVLDYYRLSADAACFSAAKTTSLSMILTV